MATQAIWYWRKRGEAACYFCGAQLADLGGAFLTHVAETVACRDEYAAWVAHIDEDRPGG